MIEKTLAFKVGEETFGTLVEAQEHELFELLKESCKLIGDGDMRVIVGKIVEDSDRIIDILTTKANSRTKARKVNGAVKKRKATTAFHPETGNPVAERA